MIGADDGELLSAGEIAEGHAPTSRITIPSYVDYHMIMDFELDQLSWHETSVLASLGFVALGAAMGLIVPLASSLEKLDADPPLPFLRSDAVCIAAFSASMILALICLSIAGLAWWRNRGLAQKIRKRPKYGAFATAGKAPAES